MVPFYFELPFYNFVYKINAMAKLLATDLDGTLFYPKRRIRMVSKKTISLIQKFLDDGNYFAVISGRNFGPCTRVFSRIDREGYAIGCNGSFISKGSKVIKKSTFEPHILEEVIKFVESNYKIHGMYVMSDDDELVLRDHLKPFFYRVVQRLWYAYQGALRNPYKVCKQRFDEIVKTGKALKIMFLFGVSKKSIALSKESNKEIREKFGDAIESSWSNEFIEISPAGCSKSNGLKFLADYLKIQHDDVIVVGDSGNDISMFKEYQENSFCMSHASLSVSKYAKHTIKNFEEIEKYLKQDTERK